MKKWLSLIFAVSLVLSGCGGGDDEPQEQADQNDQDQATNDGGEAVDVAAAEKVYQNSACMNCHGGNLQGGAGPKLIDIGARKTKAEILHIIVNGQGSMPGGMLSGDDAELVASWLASLK
jgi:cytochrome c551